MNFLKRTTANSLAQQAEQKASEGNFAEALDLAGKALEQDDKNALVWKTVTKIHFSLGDTANAVTSMRRYLALAPEDAPAWSVLGSALKDLQEFEEAEKALLRAVEIAPGDATCWYNLGVMYESDRPEAAVDAYLRAIECNPNDADAWYNLSNMRHALGDYAGAAEAARRTIALQPEDANAWDNLALFLMCMEQWEEAEEAAQYAVKLDPHHSNAHVRLNAILEHLGKASFAPAQTLHAMTSRCGSFGHPEFLLRYEDPPVTPDTVQWLVDYLESAVESGERFKAGETVQIGWMITQLQDVDGALCMYEPDFRSKELNWVPSVTQTLIDLLMQQLTLQAVSFEEEADMPNWYQTAIACKRFGENNATFNMQRVPGSRENQQDCGWFCGCMFVDCNHEDMANLRLASLYELSILNRQIVQYLSLPEGCDVVVTADGVYLGRHGKPVKVLAHNQT